MLPPFSEVGGPRAHLGVEVVVQQHVAGLQVQVEQGGGQAVEEVHTQSHLVDQPEDQRPVRSFV